MLLPGVVAAYNDADACGFEEHLQNIPHGPPAQPTLVAVNLRRRQLEDFKFQEFLPQIPKRFLEGMVAGSLLHIIPGHQVG